MQWVGGLVSTIIRLESSPRILHLTSVLFICRMGPRGLPWQGVATAGICKNLCSSGLLVVFFLDIFIQITSSKRMWPFLHISGISKHVEFLRHNNLLRLPRETPWKKLHLSGTHWLQWWSEKNTTTFARHPCVARFVFSHSESFSRTNPSNVHQKKNDKKQIGYLAYMLDSYSPAQ